MFSIYIVPTNETSHYYHVSLWNNSFLLFNLSIINQILHQYLKYQNFHIIFGIIFWFQVWSFDDHSSEFFWDSQKSLMGILCRRWSVIERSSLQLPKLHLFNQLLDCQHIRVLRMTIINIMIILLTIMTTTNLEDNVVIIMNHNYPCDFQFIFAPEYHCYYLSHKIMIKRSSEDIWPDYLQTGTLLWKVCAPVELWNWLSCQNLFWIFWHFNIWQYLSQMLNIWTSIQVDGFQNRYFAFWHPLKSLCYIYSKNN